MKATVEHRFWSKVDKSSDCWIWTAGRFGAPNGRGNGVELAKRFGISRGTITDVVSRAWRHV
jgi:hypothetical protein